MTMITSLVAMAALSLPAQMSPNHYARRSKYAAFHARQAEEDRRAMIAIQQAQEKAEKEYRAMLPFLLEQQRQMLQYEADMRRNQAISSVAAAVDRQTRAAQQQARSSQDRGPGYYYLSGHYYYHIPNGAHVPNDPHVFYYNRDPNLGR
jgi:hypothetical protein